VLAHPAAASAVAERGRAHARATFTCEAMVRGVEAALVAATRAVER
jgi:hypothetical protein